MRPEDDFSWLTSVLCVLLGDLTLMVGSRKSIWHIKNMLSEGSF